MGAADEKRRYIPQHTYCGGVQRDDRFDNIRGVLIILVVIGHFLMPLYQTRFITGIFYAIYIFHMPCFILVSGYYAKSCIKNGRFRWGKVVQVLWLYFLYENVVFITEGLVYGRSGPIPNYFYEEGAPWYLLTLGTYYLITPLISRVKKAEGRLITVLFSIVLVIILKYLIHVESFLCIDRTLSFLPFYIAGFYLSIDIVSRYVLWSGKRIMELVSVIILLIVLLLSYDVLLRWNLVVYGADFSRYAEHQHSYIWLINLGWYICAFVISMAFIGAMPGRRMIVITDLGKNTLPIYFLHRPIRDLLEYAGFFELINPHSKINVILYILMCAGLTILLGSRPVSRLFAPIRSVFDPLLKRVGAL